MATNLIEVTFKASNMETLKRSIAYWVKHFKASKPGPNNFMLDEAPLAGLTASEGCQLYSLQIQGYGSSCYKVPIQFGVKKSIYAPKSQCKVLNLNKKEMIVEIPDWLVETWITENRISPDPFRSHIYTPEKIEAQNNEESEPND